MRTTVDIPDDLLRRAKSEAALRGRKLKDLVEEGLRRVLDTPLAGSDVPPPKKVTAHDLLKDLIFDDDVDSPADLSTNKKYFDDFGR
jgi:hypothetical protein